MAYPDEVLADSPILYWKLDETSGTTAADASGNSNTGTISATGVTYSQTGVADGGTALLFDGAAGSVVSPSLSPASSVVTFECWASFPSFNNTDDLLAEYSINTNSNFGAFYADPCAAAGNFSIACNGSSGPIRTRSFTRPSTGMFHHLVFVYDITSSTTVFKAYVDGVLQTLSGTGNTSSGTFGNYVLHLASRRATSLFLNATIDHVAFYNTELSAGRVTAHYNVGAGITFVPKVILI